MKQQAFTSSDEVLEHFGVKGMKWGVRKERAKNLTSGMVTRTITRSTKNGDTFTLHPSPPSKLQKALAFASKNYADDHANQSYLTVKDKHGKKIGQTNFWVKEHEPQTLYVNWISVEKSARGRGYAAAIMRSTEEIARSKGMKKMALEVPGNAPDARHIYTQMGFRVTKEADPEEAKRDPVWGGLTEMEKHLD
jgi:ribosomal protein S18 acetylase RimI-like enzyme